jgi:hypothetical protein
MLALPVALVLDSPALGQQPRVDESYFRRAPGAALDPSYLPALVDSLVAESRRLVDEVNYEYAGSYPGQQVITRAVALGQSAEQVGEALGRSGPQSSRFQRALAGLDAAIGGMQNAIGSAGGYGQATSRTMRRIDRLSSDIRVLAAAPGGGYYPPPVATGIDRATLARIASGVEADVNQAVGELYNAGYARNYPYDRAVRELETIGYGVQGVQSMVDAQAPDDQLRQGVKDARSRAGQVDIYVRTAASTAPAPPNFNLYWERAKQGLEGLGQVASGGAVTPGPLPPIRPPVLPPVLPPIQPPILPPIYPPAGSGPIDLIDQMGGELNAFLGQIQATINAVPEGFQFQREGRALQGSLSGLRQRLAAGRSGPGVVQAYRQVEQDYRQLLGRVDRVSRGRPGPNNDRIRRMVPMLEQLRAQIPG